MESETKKNYCTQNQKRTLINLMQEKENEPLLSGKFSPNFTFQIARSKWQNIASILNSAPGASKDWKQWKKTWQDLRSKTKKKKSDQIKYVRGTGGGPSYSDELDATDELILSTIPSSSITGDIYIEETPVDMDSFFSDLNTDQPVDDTPKTREDAIPKYPVEIVLDDHLYSKENNTVPPTSAPKKKRSMASQRLHTSAVAASTLAEVSKNTLDVQKEYYAKKLILFERQVVAVETLVDILKQRNVL